MEFTCHRSVVMLLCFSTGCWIVSVLLWQHRDELLCLQCKPHRRIVVERLPILHKCECFSPFSLEVLNQMCWFYVGRTSPFNFILKGHIHENMQRMHTDYHPLSSVLHLSGRTHELQTQHRDTLVCQHTSICSEILVLKMSFLVHKFSNNVVIKTD